MADMGWCAHIASLDAMCDMEMDYIDHLQQLDEEDAKRRQIDENDDEERALAEYMDKIDAKNRERTAHAIRRIEGGA